MRLFVNIAQIETEYLNYVYVVDKIYVDLLSSVYINVCYR